jgi:UDP-N-acetylglucosamine acyltransferase
VTRIHPTALVDPSAELGDGVEVGPFAIVEAGAKVGGGSQIGARAHVQGGVIMGVRNRLHPGAVIGGDPQDRKWSGGETSLIIGDDNVFGEFATVHRSNSDRESTTIGSGNFLMGFVHVGHNARLGSGITVANATGISGHVIIEDFVTIGGMAGIHQFVTIGRRAMVGGMSRIVRDVPPYMLVQGQEQKVHDVNAVGLRRSGITSEARAALHKACKLLYRSQLATSAALEIVRREVPETPEVLELIAFVERSRAGRSGRGAQR